ncbi:acetylglutamate kinase [Lentilactobacillus fungorum]|uniref:Acetylglutamate kinase n=1 Tax=Lentilactobacillus fungorum TaxID=2201250 RepID=A0ABQ3W1W3_9LACO|nr:acetylglutamate kinase [Lentilactobacillus fungorum]GHP14618.1 acetylglutamate kinase [Lentilactobacillus fungorum]
MSSTIVIKVGGHATNQLSPTFYQQLTAWHQAGKHILIIHGGGPQISEWSSQLHLPINQVDGIRVTDSKTLKVTQAVLLGLVQPMLCKQLADHGLPVMGLNASGLPVIYGDYLDQAVYGEVGQVIGVNRQYIDDALSGGRIGVCAPLAVNASDQLLNVNGDAAAAGVAKLLNAEKLVLLTDVPGVMLADHVVSHLTQEKAQQLVAQKQIKAGMQPKLAAAFEAFKSGVKEVAITNELKQPGTNLVSKQIVM